MCIRDSSTIHMVDAKIDAVHARDKKLGKPYLYPQVALIALDPRTGQVLALVGGRNYGSSQVNHAVSHRPTGSIFKPFVYASAFQTAVEGTMLPEQTSLFSPVTMLDDSQATFGEGTPYEYTPHNFQGESYGVITARYALMRSDNVATIKLAIMVEMCIRDRCRKTAACLGSFPTATCGACSNAKAEQR